MIQSKRVAIAAGVLASVISIAIFQFFSTSETNELAIVSIRKTDQKPDSELGSASRKSKNTPRNAGIANPTSGDLKETKKLRASQWVNLQAVPDENDVRIVSAPIELYTSTKSSKLLKKLRLDGFGRAKTKLPQGSYMIKGEGYRLTLFEVKNTQVKVFIKQFKIAEYYFGKKNFELTGRVLDASGAQLPEGYGEICVFLDPKNPQFGVEPKDESFYLASKYSRDGSYSLKLNMKDWQDRRGVILFRDHFQKNVLFFGEIGPVVNDLKFDIVLQKDLPEIADFFTNLAPDTHVTSLTLSGRRGMISALPSSHKVTGVKNGDTLIVGVKSDSHSGTGYVQAKATVRGNRVQITAPPIRWRTIRGVLRDANGESYKDALVELSGAWASVRSDQNGEFRLIFTYYKSNLSLRVYDRFYKPKGSNDSIPTPLLERDIEDQSKDLNLELTIPKGGS